MSCNCNRGALGNPILILGGGLTLGTLAVLATLGFAIWLVYDWGFGRPDPRFR